MLTVSYYRLWKVIVMRQATIILILLAILLWAGAKTVLAERIQNIGSFPENSWERAVIQREMLALAGRMNPALGVDTMNLIAGSIWSTCEKRRLDPRLIASVIAVESSYHPGAVSRCGAKGLMQLTDSVLPWLDVEDPFNIYENICGGALFLSDLMRSFQCLELTLAAYNAGPGRVRKYRAVPPITETRCYVRRVMAFYRRMVEKTDEIIINGLKVAGHTMGFGFSALSAVKRDCALPALCPASLHPRTPDRRPPGGPGPDGLRTPPGVLRFLPGTWRWLRLLHLDPWLK